ncbi:MAG: replication-associated recombination protein A [bacterium]|nr:replication-associated recombination protein A [bacterium]
MTSNITNPLADRMRPESLDEFVGQEHLIGKERILRKIIESDKAPSMIFWGPPGSGKTTLARIIAKSTGAEFVKISAVSSGVKEMREIIKKARFLKSEKEKRTIFFIDEIHRFNKSQQDALLPYVEDGTLTLIGATTENPSFEVNSALLSRSRVFVLKMLEPEDIEVIVKNALADNEKGLGMKKIDISEKDIGFIAAASGGDARVALNVLELSVNLTTSENKTKQIKVERKIIEEAFQKSASLYDKAGEEHYNIISALHKSMRGGNADASLYWLGRMLEGGEDPLYVARRLIRFASEDIGIANSFALPQATAAYDACHYIGMPECGVNLAQAAVYMAKSKKSNKLYEAYLEVQRDIKNFPNLPVPLHLRNAPTDLMKNLGYGKGYKYTPSFKNPKDAKQEYLPEKLKNRKYLED